MGLNWKRYRVAENTKVVTTIDAHAAGEPLRDHHRWTTHITRYNYAGTETLSARASRLYSTNAYVGAARSSRHVWMHSDSARNTRG